MQVRNFLICSSAKKKGKTCPPGLKKTGRLQHSITKLKEWIPQGARIDCYWHKGRKGVEKRQTRTGEKERTSEKFQGLWKYCANWEVRRRMVHKPHKTHTKWTFVMRSEFLKRKAALYLAGNFSPPKLTGLMKFENSWAAKLNILEIAGVYASLWKIPARFCHLGEPHFLLLVTLFTVV